MIVFVCGISKSGKTTIIQRASMYARKWEHLRASSLIQAQGGVVSRLSAASFIDNQPLLISAIQASLPQVDKHIVLDGHLSVETEEGPQLVPDREIDRLPIVGVILIEDAVEEVTARRRTLGLWESEEEVADLMGIEKIQARRLARRKVVEFREMGSSEVETFIAVLEELFMKSSSASIGR